MGAIGLFEEKYGERVRVLSAGDFSKELCGGTHVSHLGEIGSFKLLSETSTGAGARRIEALTGPGAIEWHRNRERELLEELSKREQRVSELEAELKQARSSTIDVAGLASGARDVGPAQVLATEVDAADMDALLALSDQLRDRLGSGAAILLGARSADRAFLAATLGPDAVAAGLSAADIIRVAAPIVGGGGGGKERLARAGGKDPTRLPDAIEAAEDAILAGLEGNGRPPPE
jgi:alanyl-tRNA synthetase